MTKKLFILCTSLLIIFGLSGCKKQEPTNQNQAVNEPNNQNSNVNESTNDFDNNPDVAPLYNVIKALSECQITQMQFPKEPGRMMRGEELSYQSNGLYYTRNETEFTNGSIGQAKIYMLCEDYKYESSDNANPKLATQEDVNAGQRQINQISADNNLIIKTAVFPRDKAYFSVVFEMADDNAEQTLAKLQNNEADEQTMMLWNAVDFIANSIVFDGETPKKKVN